MKKNKSKYPIYKGGGFFKNVGDFAGNMLKGSADTALTALGASNVIQDSDYSGSGSNLFKGYANTVGGIGKAVLPMAANMIAPGSGMAVQAAQGAIGSFNPQSNDPNQQGQMQQSNGQQIGQLANTSMQLANIDGAFRMGGKMLYPDGGKVKSNKSSKDYDNFTQESINYNKKFLDDYHTAMLKSEMLSNFAKPSNETHYNPSLYLMGNYQNMNGNDSLKYSDTAPYFRQLMDGVKKVNQTYNPEYYHRNGGIKNFYEDGGQEPNAQIEKQENFITPQGDFGQVNGPSHEQGGIDVNIPENTIIFSDKLKPQGSKKTFAILNKTNNTNKETKILEDKNSTNESKKSAQLMLAIKKANSIKLFQEQEDLKNTKTNNYIKRLGGVQRFPGGGVFQPQGFNDENNYGYAEYNGNDIPATSTDGNWLQGLKSGINAYKGITPYTDYMAPNPNTKSIGKLDELPSGFSNNSIKASSADSLNSNNKSFNFPNVNKDALYQGIGTLAQSAGQLAYLHDQGKNYDKQQFYNYTPKYMDPSAALRDADLQANATNNSIRDASGGNAGNYLANRIASQGVNTMNKAAIRTNYENMNSQIDNQGQQYNIGNKYMTDDVNAQRKGQALSNYYNTIGSLGTNVANGMYTGIRDNKANQMDQQRLEMYKYLYPNNEYKSIYSKMYP